MHRHKTHSFILLGAILLVALAFPALVGLAADWYWFQAVGFQAVFTKMLDTRIDPRNSAPGSSLSCSSISTCGSHNGAWRPMPIVFSARPDQRPSGSTSPGCFAG